MVDKVWVEVELVVIIGKKCREISSDDAHNYILGYTIGSDITAQNILKRDWHLARSKAFDNFAPVGPYLVTEINPNGLSLRNLINNKEAQKGNTKDMIYDVNKLITLISSVMTLEPWDLIFTGTPAKARDAIVKPGDSVKHTIDDFGDLEFKII